MNKKTLTKLEFYKITELLMNEATTPGGQRKCRNLKPSTDLTKIESMQEETAAAFTRIVKKGHLSFSGCYPIEESMKRLEVGGCVKCLRASAYRQGAYRSRKSQSLWTT